MRGRVDFQREGGDLSLSGGCLYGEAAVLAVSSLCGTLLFLARDEAEMNRLSHARRLQAEVAPTVFTFREVLALSPEADGRLLYWG